MNFPHESHLVWIDLEMSGLEPEKDSILEIATIVTDKYLNILEIGPNIAIHQPQSLLDRMDSWNKDHHSRSGLIKKVLKSEINIEEAEKISLKFIKKYTIENKNPLCGNSIGQDRRFLYKYMPKLSAQLSYRSIDVTSFKELFIRWFPHMPLFQKQEKHQALDDIQESIAELNYYKGQMFLPITHS